MLKKFDIFQPVNTLDEAYMLLYYWINVNDLEKARDRYAKIYQQDIENYNKKFNIIIEMYDYVKNNLDISKERLEYYFKERNSDISTFCSLALLWDEQEYDKKLLSYEERFKRIEDKIRIKRYAKIIEFERAENTPDGELKTLVDLINFIDASSYEDSAKWEVIKIYNHQKKYYMEAYNILDKVIRLLTSKYSKQLHEIEQNFLEYWTQYQEENDIVNTVVEKTKVSWKHSAKGTIIMPLIFSPFSVTISCDTEVENACKDVIRISILLDDRFELTSKKIAKDDIINLGKLLCDKSKVDILEYVSKKPAYGKEIADKLNLSTATISYHIKPLLQTGLLKATIDAKKVYYSFDRESFSNYMDEIKRYITEL